MGGPGEALSASRLREVLSYDARTGVFVWRKRLSGKRAAGTVAGYVCADGYRVIKIDKVRSAAHRLAWLYVHGVMPSKQIDHINGLRDDNRIANLRLATPSENAQNAVGRQNKDAPGVSCSYGRYMARIAICKTNRYLGCFGTVEEAAAAYVEAKRKLHPFAPSRRLREAE